MKYHVRRFSVTQTCDVMVLAAHPDDAEFGAAGTVARWVNEDVWCRCSDLMDS